jgi:hypothetical protein
MTDPVRPVAPREIIEHLREREKARLAEAYKLPYSQTGINVSNAYLKALHDVEVELLAAAPVPCAASPADRKSDSDDDIPIETRRELMHCATRNSTISYYYLCDIFRRGRRAGRATAPVGDRDGFAKRTDYENGTDIYGDDAAAPVPCVASPADPWQPIETAPKDGRNVLGWLTTTHPPIHVIVFWTGERWSKGDRRVGLPIMYWMPLPTPPRATGEGARDEQTQTVQSETPSCGKVDARAQSSHRLVGDASCAVAEPSGHNAADPTVAPVAVSLDPHRLPTNDDMPPGNWHAIEGPNGICACGPVEGCPERLQRFIRTAVDFWHAKANFLERERERAVEELPDAFARAPGSLALKIQRYREFVTPYVDLARLRGEAAVRVGPFGAPLRDPGARPAVAGAG